MARINEPVVGDKSLRLQAESFLRPLTIGADWSMIRIGMLVTVDPVQIVNGGLLIGLSAGALAWENTSANVVGYHVGGTALFGGTWGLFSTYQQWPAGACGFGVSKVGTTITTVNDAGQQRAISTVPANRTTLFIDIFRGSPNYTVIGWVGNAPYATINTAGNFLTWLEYTVSPPHAISGLPFALSVAYSGSAALDTLIVRWQNTSPGLEIYRINVIRFS
jgi:hypothetical protein